MQFPREFERINHVLPYKLHGAVRGWNRPARSFHFIAYAVAKEGGLLYLCSNLFNLTRCCLCFSFFYLQYRTRFSWYPTKFLFHALVFWKTSPRRDRRSITRQDVRFILMQPALFWLWQSASFCFSPAKKPTSELHETAWKMRSRFSLEAIMDVQRTKEHLLFCRRTSFKPIHGWTR